MVRSSAIAAALPGLLAAAASCLPLAAPPGHATPFVPGIRIIKPEQAASLGLPGRPHELPFGDNQDGTKLVLDFLDEAKRAGARYVSDIRIVLVTRRAAGLARCETRLLPFVKRDSILVPHQQPARVESRMVPKVVTQTVTEQRSQCRMVSHPVTRMETSYQYQYDYLSKSSRSVPVTRLATSTQYRNECTTVPTTSVVTRYEYQLETRFIPPSVTYLRAHFADFDLVEAAASCAPQDAARGPQPHRITGTIHVDRVRP